MPQFKSGDIPIQLSEGLVCRSVDDDLLILDEGNQQVHQLNITATFIWEHCNGSHTIESIANQFSKAFDIPAKSARRDVESVVSELVEKTLLTFKAIT